MPNFDREVLEDVTGIRAVWALYRSGDWTSLSEFGLERSEIEDKFLKFENDNVVGHRLSKPQCSALVRAVPDVQYASVELRLAYALQFHEVAMSTLEGDKEIG